MAESFWLWGDGQTILWGDAQELLIAESGDESGAQNPTGGWVSLPRDFGRTQTAEARRRERERLGIEPAQQRAIDRAAVKIASVIAQGGLVSPQAVIDLSAFDHLLTLLRPTEGEVMALAQAIVDRLLWMAAEQEEEEAVVRLMMEMD